MNGWHSSQDAASSTLIPIIEMSSSAKNAYSQYSSRGYHELVAFLMKVFEVIQLDPRMGLTYVLSRERIRMPPLD